MIVAAHQDILIRQGRTFDDFAFQVWEGAPGREVLSDLTGCTGETRLYDEDGALLATFQTVIDIDNGLVWPRLESESTAALSFERGRWECVLNWPEPRRDTVAEGNAAFKRSLFL